jgi:hypothetical protein
MAMQPEAELLSPSDLGKKLVIALQSVSDPQALMQAISDRSIAGLSRQLTTRLDAMEQATSLWHDDLVRIPTEVQKACTSLREVLEVQIKGDKQLYLEKFIATEETIKVLKDTINDRFTQNDQNTEKAFNAAKQAVGERDASNAASANKSEKNLLDALAKLDDNVKTLSGTSASQISSNKSTLDDKINDIKDQIARLDNRISSSESTKKGSGETVIWLFFGLSSLIGVGGFIVAMISLFHR